MQDIITGLNLKKSRFIMVPGAYGTASEARHVQFLT